MELSVKNFGPIADLHMDFGDITFLIGPQASGKSLSLELLKLILDRHHIISTLRNYNFVFNKTSASNIIDWYFGEGLSYLFGNRTEITLGGTPFSPKDLLSAVQDNQKSQPERVFYVPAQRILSIADGRPKNFIEFDTDSPYVLRRFSEILRVFLQGGLGNPEVIFPMRNRLKGAVKNAVNQTIFHDGQIVIDKSGSQRKMKLEVGGMRIPFMAWSAGQKEFMPLLLAIYCLSGPPSPVVNKKDYEWVIIEEPEMGLHPRAIQSVLLEMLELMQSGYKVVVSTHSSLFLEFVWAFNLLKGLPEQRFRQALCELFGIGINTTAANLFDGILEKTVRTYYSGKQNEDGKVSYMDISTLDAFSEDENISEWGGLTSFSGKASEIVSKYSLGE